MVGNALHLKGFAFGRFDFKGTTGIDNPIQDFVRHLSVAEPPASPRLTERLGWILTALTKRQGPALLIFDTYEVASAEAREWIEKQLLPCVVRETWLRVVVAGQQVPRRVGTVWEADAVPSFVLQPPRPADWLAYSKPHRPDLTLEKVEIACELAKNRAGLLSQLLGDAG